MPVYRPLGQAVAEPYVKLTAHKAAARIPPTHGGPTASMNQEGVQRSAASF